MAVIEYPATLPSPEEAPVVPDPRRLVSGEAPGFQARNFSRDFVGMQTLTFFLSGTEAEGFRLFWEDTLVYGGRWFMATWPFMSGTATLARKFASGLRWSHIHDGVYRVQAEVEFRGAGLDVIYEPPQGAWWDFDETVGSAYLDKIAGHHLTVAGATTATMSVSGVRSNAHYRGGEGPSYSSRLIYLPRSDTGLDFGSADSFSIGAWVNRRSLMNTNGLLTRVLMGRNGGSTGDASYDLVFWNADGTVRFSIIDSGSVSRSTSPLATPSTTWCLVVGVCDVVTQELSCFVNTTQSAIVALPSGGAAGPGISNFCIGHPLRNDVSTSTAIDQRQADAYYDMGFVFPRALSVADVSWLYNGGSGRSSTEARLRGLFQP